MHLQGLCFQAALSIAYCSKNAIRAAATAIKGAVERTPLTHSRTLSEMLGAEIWLKFENLQYTASFKDRGSLFKLLR